MTRAAFQSRLKTCVERGNLTVADLHRWFGRPYATVRSWLDDGYEPAGGPVTVRRAHDRLAALEDFVRLNGRSLREMPMRERAQSMRR